MISFREIGDTSKIKGVLHYKFETSPSSSFEALRGTKQTAEAISRKAQGIATPSARNDKVRKQCVTNHMNEYKDLTRQ